jgi:mannose-6-phosphate isomerase-like protein (cupin superfamily)
MDGTLLIESKQGDNTAALEKAQSYAREAGVEHNVINANDYEFAFVEVELKPS